MGKPLIDPKTTALFIVPGPEADAMKALAQDKQCDWFEASKLDLEKPPEHEQLVFACAPDPPVRAALRALGRRVHILDPRAEKRPHLPLGRDREKRARRLRRAHRRRAE